MIMRKAKLWVVLLSAVILNCASYNSLQETINDVHCGSLSFWESNGKVFKAEFEDGKIISDAASRVAWPTTIEYGQIYCIKRQVLRDYGYIQINYYLYRTQ